MIEFKDVSKIYREKTETRALDRVSFTVEQGEFVFVIGESGAGKSTLFRLLLGMEKPTEGSIRMDGETVETIPARKLPLYRRQFGVVFQDFRLLKDMSVRENVAFALRVVSATGRSIVRKTAKALEEVGLTDKADSLPAQLSGGEQQRTAIARALVNSPLVILADEPTGNLDPASSLEVMELLDSLNRKGTTVIAVTHDAAMVNRFRKRVITMKDGRILSDVPEGGYGDVS